MSYERGPRWNDISDAVSTAKPQLFPSPAPVGRRHVASRKQECSGPGLKGFVVFFLQSAFRPIIDLFILTVILVEGTLTSISKVKGQEPKGMECVTQISDEPAVDRGAVWFPVPLLTFSFAQNTSH